MNLPKAVLFFLVSGFLCQIVYYYPVLPEKIASHFNAYGEPDRWMSKQSNLIFQLVLLAFIIFFGFVFPTLIKKLPVSIINMPNKDYWLAPERKDSTFRILSRHLEWFGISLAVLLFSINQLVINANLSNQNLSSVSWYILGAFLLFVGLWGFRLNNEFKIAK